MRSLLLLISLALFTKPGNSQYHWQLENEKNGIRVYLSDINGSSFKAAKVECTFAGTYAKLISVLTNISRFPKWIYHNKTSTLIKKNSAYDYLYYSETSMPFPLSNRDLVIRLRIRTDSLPRFLSISGVNDPDELPTIPGRVRIPHYRANWKVTMPTPKTISITYIIEVDPGGSLPAWAANPYADKGPLETFLNLAEELKK